MWILLACNLISFSFIKQHFKLNVLLMSLTYWQRILVCVCFIKLWWLILLLWLLPEILSVSIFSSSSSSFFWLSNFTSPVSWLLIATACCCCCCYVFACVCVLHNLCLKKNLKLARAHLHCARGPQDKLLPVRSFVRSSSSLSSRLELKNCTLELVRRARPHSLQLLAFARSRPRAKFFRRKGHTHTYIH